MQLKRWHFGVLASVVWVVVAVLLASWRATWVTAWKLQCYLTAAPPCAGSTLYFVVHWRAIGAIVLCPLALSWLVASGLVLLRRQVGRSGQ
jgi:hypothetical protein